MYKKTGNYISLQEATKYCEYSQEYLSLRARQGRLKAIKSGRNWVTKKEWLEKYLSDIGKCAKNIKKIEEIPKIWRIQSTHIIHQSIEDKQEASTPEGLTVKELNEVLPARPSQITTLRFLFSFGLVVVLIIGVGIYARTSLQAPFRQINPYIAKMVNGGVIITEEIAKPIGREFIAASKEIEKEISKMVSKIAKDEFALDIVKYTANIFKEYGRWLGDQVSGKD